MKNFFKNQKGQSIIELLITIGLASLMFPAIFFGILTSREGKVQQIQRQNATSLILETQEALRSIKERDWDLMMSTYSLNTQYYPVTNTDNTWVLNSGTQTTNDITRYLIMEEVERDSNGNIVESGGSTDPSTIKVTVTVTWGSPIPNSLVSTTYLTNNKNLTFEQTTKGEFNQGTLIGTVTNGTTDNSEDGNVVLEAGGGSNWCSPELGSIKLNLEGQADPTDISAVVGNAYYTFGGNASGIGIGEVDIAQSDPPVPTEGDKFQESQIKTYGLFTYLDNIYVATDRSRKAVVIIDRNTMSQVGFFDEDTNDNDAQSVFVTANVGYITVNNKLHLFDNTSLGGSQTQTKLGSTSLNAIGEKIVVVGDHAYVATRNITNQLQIFNISNPNSPSLIRSYSLGNNQPGVDIYVNETESLIYITTAKSTGNPNFFVLNITDLNNMTLSQKASFSTQDMNPKALAVVSGNRVILVGAGGEQYQVLNTNRMNEGIIEKCGSYQNADSGFTIYAVAPVTDTVGVWSYILTSDDNNEFQIIEGGGGGGNNNNGSGTFESSIFDAGRASTFNRLIIHASEPSQATSINFQIAITGDENADCNNATYEYLGPNGTGTADDVYTIDGGQILIGNYGSNYNNPGRCMRFKAYLNSDEPTNTPVLYDFTVNYSP